MCNVDKKEYDEAKYYFKKAIEINPTMYESYFSLGQIFLINNNLEEATKMYKKAIPGSNVMASSYYQLAKIATLKNDEARAMHYLNSAIELDSSYREKALEEPIFSKIKEYVLGISVASKAFNSAVDVEISSKSSSTKKAFNIDESEEQSEPVVEDTKENEYAKYELNPTEEIKQEEKEFSDDDYEANYHKYIEGIDEATEKIESHEEPVIEEKVEDSIIEEDNVEKILDTEESLQEENFEEESYDEDDDETVEQPKEHKFLNFFKNVFGITEDDEDDEDVFDESEEQASNVRVVPEDNPNETHFDYENYKRSSSYKEDDEDRGIKIYEKFKKLKEEEDAKAKKLNARVRYLSKDEASEPEEEFTINVRRVDDSSSKKSEYLDDYDRYHRKKSFDYDESVKVVDDDSSSKLDDYISKATSGSTEDSSSQTDDTDDDIGFDFIKRYKR